MSACNDRNARGIGGPLFIGTDTHALSAPALMTAVEVLIANGVTTMVDAGDGYTPTPLISHAILGYNRSRTHGLAEGIVITPSHNPPAHGDLKYNPPHGGRPTRRRTESGLHRHDYVSSYVADLESVIDMNGDRRGWRQHRYRSARWCGGALLGSDD